MEAKIPQARRRWFQFGISNLLWLMVVCALAVYAFQQRRERMRLEAYQAQVEEQVRQMKIRDQFLRTMHMGDFPDFRTQPDRMRLLRDAPEAPMK